MTAVILIRFVFLEYILLLFLFLLYTYTLRLFLHHTYSNIVLAVSLTPITAFCNLIEGNLALLMGWRMHIGV